MNVMDNLNRINSALYDQTKQQPLTAGKAEQIAASSQVQPQSADVVTPKEEAVQTAVQEAAGIASLFVGNAQAVQALSDVTNVSPIFIHLGFMLAHLFQSHANSHK